MEVGACSLGELTFVGDVKPPSTGTEEEHGGRQSPAFPQVACSSAVLPTSPVWLPGTEDCADTSNAHLHSCKNSFFPFQPHSHSQKPEHVKINVKGAGNTSKTICRLYVTDLINTSLQYLSNSTQAIHWPCYSHAGSPCVKKGQINFHS